MKSQDSFTMSKKKDSFHVNSTNFVQIITNFGCQRALGMVQMTIEKIIEYIDTFFKYFFPNIVKNIRIFIGFIRNY
jgi:Na+-transporting NADH:ubiquinone oxidoreductase subunit NqrD